MNFHTEKTPSSINSRIKFLRKQLKLNQKNFGDILISKQSTISDFEKEGHNITDKNIALICNTFHVNEEWLRYGKGEMLLAPDYISLDDYAKQNNLSELELKFIKKYMSIDENIRKHLMEELKEVFSEDSIKNDND